MARGFRSLFAMAAAAAAAAAFVGLPTARASDVPIEGPQSSDTPGPWTHRHRGLVVGTPTGGGKYPFLVVVVWQAGVQDPRTTQDIWCHGTMVTSDVVLVTNSCRPDQGYVMVGDSFNNESMQFRVVSSQETHHGLVSHPAGLHFLFKIEPVTFEGFYPAAINKNTDGVFDGQDVTMVGYGTIDPITESIFPGEAYEAQVKVFSYWEEGFWYWPQAGGSGDGGTPLLDRSKSIIGIALYGYYAVRVSYVADWIERNACALSESKEALPFCPDLVCPADSRLLGYPWALLPNGTGSVVGIRGFNPVRVTQWPPPGTPLWRNTTTNVKMTAIDAAGRQLECVWVVLVAPLVALGQMGLDLPNGTYNTTGRFQRTAPEAISGRIYKMSGRTGDQLRGSGSSSKAKLRRGSDKHTGRPLTLKTNERKGSISVPRVPLSFENGDTSDVELDVEVVRNARASNVTYKVYGQVLEYWWI